MIKNYEEQVYAGVLGKVIGVYVGRPIEGWTKARIEARWGRIERYVHEDRGVPLVVTDDDISGTFTFVRALEDSGFYAATTPAFFGDTWLNYLIPHQTVLWWGGMGVSTEHTAYLRLKQGLKAPHSGAIATNGRIVAEQIGAQIFIDALGLVAPGRPELAAELARRAAGVSHDGEAVHAAVVVAGMIAAAFVEKDMERLLDVGAALIPRDCLIARLHRDVRGWAARDRDWRKTYDRIEKKYGYHAYGGGCHVVPNHAVMVMAWAYAPDDFHEAQVIINTAGWDTDCNAANVGALMGVKVGLARINEKYDFQTPFGDRLMLPTAEGTRSTSDVLSEALRVAGIGRQIMGWRALPPPKGAAWHHFALPGAQHGYLAETAAGECRGAATVANVAGHSRRGRRSLRLAFAVGPGRAARVTTPIHPHYGGGPTVYAIVGTPRLYAGNQVTAHALVGKLTGAAQARIFIRHSGGLSTSEAPAPEPAMEMVRGPDVKLMPGAPASLTFTVPDTRGRPVHDLGIEIVSELPARGELFLDCVELDSHFRLAIPGADWPLVGESVPGWIRYLDNVAVPPVAALAAPDARITLTKNEGRGVLVTGTTDWRDLEFSANLAVHLADQAGLIVRYQGLERYLAVVKTPDALRLVRRHYGEQVLAEKACRWEPDDPHLLRIQAKGRRITAWCDGRQVLQAEDETLAAGGAGFLLEVGTIKIRDVAIASIPAR